MTGQFIPNANFEAGATPWRSVSRWRLRAAYLLRRLAKWVAG